MDVILHDIFRTLGETMYLLRWTRIHFLSTAVVLVLRTAHVTNVIAASPRAKKP